MSGLERHQLSDSDPQHFENEIRCSCGEVKLKHMNRGIRLGMGYLHLAEKFLAAEGMHLEVKFRDR